MPCPCSFDWKLLVDFLKSLLSFPVALLVLGLTILNRYREEIKKKIAGLTKASVAGAEALFNTDQVLATVDSVVNAVVQDTSSGSAPEAGQNRLRLLSKIGPTFNALAKDIQDQLAKEGKNKWDPFELLEHKQEWVDLILQRHPELVAYYGKEAVLNAIDYRILTYIGFAKAASYGLTNNEAV